MNTTSVTPFQQRVYDACRLIPRGRVTTYGALAQTIHCGSSQAVGQALRRNPFAPTVPCHRVIATTRHLHGFRGKTDSSELTRKRTLLEREGVRFDEDGRVAEAYMMS